MQHRTGLSCLALLALLGLAACAPQASLPRVQAGLVDSEARRQQELAVRDFMAKLDRLERVGWTIRTRNVELCGENVAFRLGLTLAEPDDFPKGTLPVLRDVLGMGERPTVILVTRGGPAQAAGLKRGDALLAVAGQAVAGKKQALEAMAKALEGGGPVPVSVERAGQRLEQTLAPVRVCAYDLFLKTDNAINAYADGRRIVVFTGLMKFVQSDDELAAILGHEMAHNNQGHIRAKAGNALLGTLLLDLPVAILTGVNPNLGGQVGAQAYSQEFEAEADYVGLYFTARAGYDIQDVADIWRRMAVENPGAITMGGSHPATAARFVALEAARDEIQAKQKDGRPLTPEMKAK